MGDVDRGDDRPDQAAPFVQGKSIKEIARDLRVSRNTVRCVPRSAKTEFSHERAVQPRPKLGAWTAELERPLAENEARARRDRLDLVRLCEAPRPRGYGGGYDAVRRHARARERKFNRAYRSPNGHRCSAATPR